MANVVNLTVTRNTEHFRGVFTSLAALQAAVPIGLAGDYADVETGDQVLRYIWERTDAEWVLSGGGSATIATPVEDFAQVLTFDHDKELEIQTGGALSFTLSPTGNVNGVGIILKLNSPASVVFSSDFEGLENSLSFDITKMNLTTLVYFADYGGTGDFRVIYSNNQLTAI